MAFAIQHNTPEVGFIQWADLHMQYQGETYEIVNGYTNSVYAYWTPVYPHNLVVSNIFPALGDEDCLVFLNKNGIALVVPTASVLPGDLIVPGTILGNAIAANVIDSTHLKAGSVVAGTIAANAVTSGTVAANAIGAAAIAANTITGDKLMAEAITARELNVSQIFAAAALIGAIKAANIDVDEFWANEANLGKVTTNHLAASVGEILDLSSNTSIRAVVSEDVLTAANTLLDEVASLYATSGALNQLTDALSTSMSQTATDIEWAVTRSRNYAVELTDTMRGNLDTIMTYMRFSEAGLDLGVLDSPFATRLSNTRLSFTQNGAEVAYISNNKLYITQAEISGTLSIGNPLDGYLDMVSTPSGVGFVWREE